MRNPLFVVTASVFALSCASADAAGTLDPGVSLELATARAANISDVRYNLAFAVPEVRAQPVTGHVSITFTQKSNDQPLVLDFRGDSASVRNVVVNGDSIAPRVALGHIVVPREHLATGANTVSLDFTSSNEALNRSDDWMYALFVPDRASTAFPSFDQPDIKARYTLALEMPSAWRALANGPEVRSDTSGNRVRVQFAETEPLSTYIFTFATGKFSVERAMRDGRMLTMYHRETDSVKVARNRDAIFDLHAAALRWLENYTQIPYPFTKYAFLAVPAFQFGGMEHPGAVWYRAGSLFLDESATQNQYLARANLISHETAHMWFGDLVTMRWFNDVWMKEVFANFMAGKIVQPSFPNLNHGLRFFLANHPAAYDIDRTQGANPIRQELENLRQAGSLYGAIIYQKAPIVMLQLEELVGESAFRDGLREYLKSHKYGNATWTDLITILDKRSSRDLASWSKAWVEEAGRPDISADWVGDGITIRQSDPDSVRREHWQQRLLLAWKRGDRINTTEVFLDGDSLHTRIPAGPRPEWILASSNGVSYGHFILDSVSARALLATLPSLRAPMLRATGLYGLWESVLYGSIAPADFLDLALRAVPMEREELITQQLLGMMRSAYWRFLSDSARASVAPRVEATLWDALDRAGTAGAKSAYWSAITGMTTTPDGVAKLHRIWETRTAPVGLPLSDQQFTSLAEELAIRGVPDAESMLDAEAARIKNPDRLARFAFIRPALSARQAARDSLFDSFRNAEIRRHESWVLDAMRYLNHPLRAAQSEHYVKPGLELLDEIQRTGDIFFPLGWMNALLDGHQSTQAADAVVAFVDSTPSMQPRLKGKLLQASDDLFRSARIVHGWKGHLH